MGPTRGLSISISEDCDPIRFEFDRDFYVQEFVKTQFAGAATHIHVVETLQALRDHFVELNVEDEGEFWETGDLEKLFGHIQACNLAIQKIVAERPDVRVKVKTPDGRIIDLIE